VLLTVGIIGDAPEKVQPPMLRKKMRQDVQVRKKIRWDICMEEWKGK
jgi:hypothetical protein